MVIMEAIYVVGDIHGCYDRLVALMDKINIDLDSEKLVFVGDYIDRGPDSFKVVEYLINLKKKIPRHRIHKRKPRRYAGKISLRNRQIYISY